MMFDKYGNRLETDSDFVLDTVEIPIYIKYTPSLQNISIHLGENRKYQISKKKELFKKSDRFEWFTGTLRCPSLETNLRDNWTYDLNITSMLSSDIVDKINYEFTKVFEYFFRNKCIRDGYQSLEGTTNLGDEFYYTDAILDRHSNSTLHLFGEGIVMSKGLTNCLVYIHGNYEVR